MKIVEPKTIAKAAIFNESGEILILTRSKEDRNRAGRFDFPGGGLDEGESADQAIRREILEEIGTSASDLKLVFAHTSYFDNLSSLRYLFIGTLSKASSIKLSNEHSDYKWMSVNEALEKHQHPVWIDGLRYLLENKQLEL